MKKIIILFSIVIVSFVLTGCQNDGIDRVADARGLSVQEYSVANIAGTDALGRTVRTGDETNGKFVGLFYHVWHGAHTTGIYNISQLLDVLPDALYNIDGTPESPLNQFHYWGEPLYGYYCSDDPWVITRHVELLTMAGVDYLVYDLTNAVVYTDAINALFEVLQTYHDQGFDVPKVAFYTNTQSRQTINRCYDLWYKDGLYSDLWFSFDEKPLIIGIGSQLTEAEKTLYFDFFDFRESQWPYGYDEDLENGFPWMDWTYPQKNFSGTVSVSLAQHPGARMSEEERSNNGRGFDYSTFGNDSDNVDSGTNFEGQWKTVFDDVEAVNNVFMTGFNEWIAIKYSDGQSVFFVDTFNEEYSRDIEMCKNGYGDNYYLQMIDNVKQFTYTEAVHYDYPEVTIDIDDASLSGWASVTANYADFAGDAMERDFWNAASTRIYTDSSHRNDITGISVAHDKENLYIKIQTLAPITDYNGTDLNWMNVFLSTGENEDSFGGYEYVINRTPGSGTTSVEKSIGGYNFENAGDARYTLNGNVMQIEIPLESLGLSRSAFTLQFKVADHVTNYQDIMDYYVTGDCAPLGRMSFQYGY